MKYSELNQEQKAMVDKAVALYGRCDNTYKWIVTHAILTEEQARSYFSASVDFDLESTIFDLEFEVETNAPASN